MRNAGQEFGEWETVVTGKGPGCSGARGEEIGYGDRGDESDDAIQGDAACVTSCDIDEELSDWAASGGREKAVDIADGEEEGDDLGQC